MPRGKIKPMAPSGTTTAKPPVIPGEIKVLIDRYVTSAELDNTEEDIAKDKRTLNTYIRGLLKNQRD
jgi:hypothetical protein